MAVRESTAGSEIEGVLDRLLAASGADAAELFVREPGANRVWLAAHRGLAARQFQERTVFEVGEGYPGIVAASGEPIVTVDLAADRRFLRTGLQRRGFRCYRCAPVRAAGEVVGSVHIASRRRGGALDEGGAALEAAASSLGGIIELGQLRAKDAVSDVRSDPSLDATRNLERRLGRALAAMVEFTEADGGIVLLRDPASGGLHPWAWSGAYASACSAVSGTSGACACSVISEGRGIITPARPGDPPRPCRIAPSEFAGVACLPLVAGDELLGVVSLGYRGRRAAAGRLMAVLGSMAQRLALDVEHAQAAVAAEQRAVAGRDLRLLGELDGLVERTLRPAIAQFGEQPAPPGGAAFQLRDVESLLRSSAREIATVHGSGAGAAAPGDAVTPGALDVRCFGPLTIFRDGQRIDAAHVERRRAWKLLQILLVNHGRAVDDDVLAELLWPEGPPPSAATQLKVLVHDVRRTLAPGDAPPAASRFVVRSGHGYAFDTSAPHRIDTGEFVSLIHWGERLAQLGDVDSALVAYRSAADLYTGDFLEDEVYSDWCAGERDYLRERFLTLLRRTATLLLARGDDEGAIWCHRRALRVDEAAEDVHRELIRLLAEAGRSDDALRQYRACEAAMTRALGRPPLRDTADLATRIRGIATP